MTLLPKSYSRRLVLVAAGCATLVVLGEYLVNSSMSLFGSNDMYRALAGIAVIVAGCILYVHTISRLNWMRAFLAGSLGLLVAYFFAYWALLPLSDKLFAAMPALTKSGTLSGSLMFLTLVVTLNLFVDGLRLVTWLVAAASIVFVGCMLVGSEAAVLTLRVSIPPPSNVLPFRTIPYAAASWILVTWAFQTVAQTTVRSMSTEKGPPS